ncbi:hypothetical protein HPB47_017203 [Ixodes persulcatus]|uniref:Uncharacterized protein n=1 Tax=Ixodes persulcatus TaxID=34615 RepID=A0AC60QQW9_IXOPE|nr:hypothetical protein HPB47_017203 [Ixodes persulcatus]
MVANIHDIAAKAQEDDRSSGRMCHHCYVRAVEGSFFQQVDLSLAPFFGWGAKDHHLDEYTRSNKSVRSAGRIPLLYKVTGIEGTYRMTCEKVMKVLRGNKDSLMAVLEAFVYDPLLNWRLMDDILETVDIGSQPTAKKAVDTSGVGDGEAAQPEALNKKALAIINRVRDKLTGESPHREFLLSEGTLDVPEQVELLIKQATSHENLCQCYIGWSVECLATFGVAQVISRAEARAPDAGLRRTDIRTWLAPKELRP